MIAIVTHFLEDEQVAFPVIAAVALLSKDLAVLNCIYQTRNCTTIESEMNSASPKSLSFFRRFLITLQLFTHFLISLLIVVSVKESALATAIYAFAATALQFTTV